MGKITGFKEFDRDLPPVRDIRERVRDYHEIAIPVPAAHATTQAARCMDCGIPFCHHSCPLGNIIPEFNDAVFQEDWLEALTILSSTNNFPEFTGRICPAPCETSCVLGIINPPVAIEYIEKSIIEIAFEKGYLKPNPPKFRTGKTVAIIGSGPAGLAAAAQLNKAGHLVTVYEKADRLGGLLRYGIPDFKLEKWVLDRRLKLMEEEGVVFKTNSYVGRDINTVELLQKHDALLLCGGSTVPRDLPIPGRDLKGIHFAMDFLEQNNRSVAGLVIGGERIHAGGKHVVVIGGGDTGSDCLGTSSRHLAASVSQIELLIKPPETRDASNPWPLWPMTLRTSSSHEEGCDRNWAILTKEFIPGAHGEVKGLKVANIEWGTKEGKPSFTEINGTERIMPCDLALLAIGFAHPFHNAEIGQLGVGLDTRGNVNATRYKTNIEKVFSAGDMRRGQSLVVWAISEGREAAREVDLYLMGETFLESKDLAMTFQL